MPIPRTMEYNGRRYQPRAGVSDPCTPDGGAPCNTCWEPGREQPICTHCDTAESVPGTHLWNGEAHHTCIDCRDANLTYCEAERVWSDDVIQLVGEETYYTRAYARMHFHESDDGAWRVDEFVVSAQSMDERTVAYGYHETTPIREHGWPEETAEHELCFGVELEMENKRSASSEGHSALVAALGGPDGHTDTIPGKYILARDGSLDASGVELITNPYTLEFHQTKFGWSDLLEKVKGIGRSGVGTDACGMHVHCNRAAISALTLGKMLVFANSNENRALLATVAQRSNSSYARAYPKRITDGKQVRGASRYDCLNITAATIEFRIFRGNLRPERVLKNIEFCHAVVTYCATASIKACQTSIDFIRWLDKNRGPYKNLVKFLAPTFGYKVTREDKTEDQ